MNTKAAQCGFLRTLVPSCPTRHECGLEYLLNKISWLSIVNIINCKVTLIQYRLTDCVAKRQNPSELSSSCLHLSKSLRFKSFKGRDENNSHYSEKIRYLIPNRSCTHPSTTHREIVEVWVVEVAGLRRIWHLPSQSHTGIVHYMANLIQPCLPSLYFYVVCSSSLLVHAIFHHSSHISYFFCGYNFVWTVIKTHCAMMHDQYRVCVCVCYSCSFPPLLHGLILM